MDLIAENQFSLQKIAEILDDAYIEVDASNEGRLQVDMAAVRIGVIYDEGTKLLAFVSIFQLKPGSALTRLELVNNLNNDSRVVRSSFKQDENVLWCDQQISIKGGVTSRWLVFSLKQFAEICLAVRWQMKEHIA
jgi:hypothetical protein